MGFVATAIAVAGAASAGATIYSGQRAATASEKASKAAQAQNAAAIQSVKDAQSSASSNAADSIKRRSQSMSQTIYTSPLGLSNQATTARKVLLGQ